VVLSVLGAAIGVQSGATRARDFAHGRPLVYVAAGILFAVVFVLLIYGIVQLAL